MHRKSMFLCVFLILVFAFTFIGCSFQSSGSSAGQASAGKTPGTASSSKESGTTKTEDGKPAAPGRETVHKCLIPEAAGEVTYGNDTVSIDASNTSEGYVMVRYSGDAAKVKLQITVPHMTTYTYTLDGDSYETFPLSEGDGSYKLDVLENVEGEMYALLFSQDIQVETQDEFKPFLYPNQYAWFTQEDKAVAYGVELSDVSSDDLDYVERVYLYVIGNIVYDEELAATVTSGYLPDVDRTLQSKKGICFDYAALMAALLRSQGIPTKLQIGYSGDAYHAWISVYLTEIGWVDDIIEFDGKSWSLMDPTLAASNSRSSLKKYIGDGDNYTVKYSY
ncbi:MAG: transglutaminase-like domain-containing protein [Lachnospiraceae bacterium]|nr:transglutaminase-like domain-containing protein [Lachnospiraceae bacterium]